MKTQWVVYKHTNSISGKSYVGQTLHSLDKRWKEHVYAALSGKSRLHFHRAIAKYPLDSWISTVLEDGISTLAEAYQKEIGYILKYSSFSEGYNMTTGGEGTPRCNPLAEKTEEEHAAFCKQQSANSKKAWNSQKVTLFNSQLKVKECDYLIDIAKKYDLDISSMYKLASGSLRQVKGWFMWKGENADYALRELYSFEHSELGLEDGITIMGMAAKYGLAHGHLSNVASGKKRHIKGWCLKGCVGNSVRPLAHNAKHVCLIFDGKVLGYKSIKEAASAFNVNSSLIAGRANGRVKSLFMGKYKVTYKIEGDIVWE